MAKLGIRYDELDQVTWRWRKRAWAAHVEELGAELQRGSQCPLKSLAF